MADEQVVDVTYAEGRRVIEIGRATPDAPVLQYPSWTLWDLVVHLAGVHGRTEMVLRTLAQDRIPTPEPPHGVDPFDWASDTLSAMVEALRVVDPNAQVWTFSDDQTPGAWERRMLIETGVHRWDAQGAIGEPDPLLDLVATNGLDEFAGFYLPRLGDVPTLELSDPNLDLRWRYGEGTPEGVIDGTASDLFLALMSRPGVVLPEAWQTGVDALASPAD